jgi:hypothetical protein
VRVYRASQEVRFANARAAEIKELVLKRERPR